MPMAIVSGLAVGLCGVVVWVAAAGTIRDPRPRGTLVALTVLAPTAALESVDSGTYVLWFMLFASFWLLLWRPRTTAGALLGGLFLALTGLSTPEVWFFAPLALPRLIALRDRRDATLLGGWALGAAVQVPAYAPRWDEALDQAARQCRAEGLSSVAVPTSPPGFAVLASCAEVIEASG